MSERKSRYILKKQEIQAFKQGDLTIFKKLFYEFQPRLYRFFWFKLRSIELAEDLVQETFLRLWKARHHLKNGTPLHLYIFRIAINLATDAFRKQKVHNRTFTSLEQVLPVAQNLWPNSEYDQLAQLIDEIITGLPEGSRTAFLLSRHEGMTHKEIARVMGISVKTVEKHIARALQELKQKLDSM